MRLIVTINIVTLFVETETPTHLPVPIFLVLPARRQLPVLAGEHVEQRHEVAVVLVPLEGRGVAPDAGHHVLHGRPVEQERL